MIKTYLFPDFDWIDLLEPNNNDLKELSRRSNILPNIIRDIESPTINGNFIYQKSQLYLVVHYNEIFSNYEDNDKLNVLNKKHIKNKFNISNKNKLSRLNCQLDEFDLIILENTIITVRYRNSLFFQHFKKQVEVELAINKNNHHLNSFLQALLQELFNYQNNQVELIDQYLDDIEEKIYKSPNSHLVRSISEIGRCLLNSHQIQIKQLRIIKQLSSLTDWHEISFFWENNLNLLINRIDELRNVYQELRQTNQELLSSKQNEIMKTLTSVTFIASPLTILASIFGMNATNIPFMGQNYDFILIILIMFLSVCLVAIYLKFKKWL